ncbi:MAG TPA: hypothetical protein VFO51_00025 [Sphingomicrobium sp.]|nr:hypothetical protein [Sphingomicrobium sp.]
MQDWEEAFRTKSRNRERRIRRARLVWRATILVLISLVILAVLWALDRITIL